MERARKARNTIRSSVTGVHGTIVTKLDKDRSEVHAVVANMQLLEKKTDELEVLNNQIFVFMLDTED